MRALAQVAIPLLLLAAGPAAADYTNFESSHVHPLAITPNTGI